jgi:MraZ protein
MALNKALFLSTHFSRIDGKGRVSFPGAFRSALAARNSQGVALYGSLVDPAIEGATVERLQQMSIALEALPPFDPQRVLFETAIFGAAQELQIDKEGRCSLPKAFLDKAGIGAEVAFLGKGSTFQIWDPAQLETRVAEAAEAVKLGAVSFPAIPAAIL